VFSIERVRTHHKVLDFDIENRPLNYWFGDRTAAEITAIGWGWVGEDAIEHRLLEPPPFHEGSMARMLTDFLDVYNEADVVTGHFIRMHDLPTINSALLEYGLEPLPSKMTSDTKLDLLRHANLSASQMSLAGMLDVKSPKVGMPQGRWRDANRLTLEGRKAAIERVEGDVRQHRELRAELLKRGWLGPPKLWHP
jgi:hypothetical protein